MPSTIALLSRVPATSMSPQVGLGPGDSVPALGQATALDVIVGHAPVVHAVDAVVVKNADSEVVATLPGAIHLDGYFGRLGMMQFEAGSNQTINQEVVDEELPSGTDVEGLLWVGLVGLRPRKPRE